MLPKQSPNHLHTYYSHLHNALKKIGSFVSVGYHNLWPRIGIFGCRLSIWLLDPSLSLQFCWVDGFSPHINHLSTSLMAQPQTQFTNLVTMVSGRSSQSFPRMPWLPIASPAILTLVLLPPSQPWHTTLPLHHHAQPKHCISRFLSPAHPPTISYHPVGTCPPTLQGASLAITLLCFP